ncbi:MAG TPA: ribosome maturation factor RimM [Actinomycetales bacterium]|nr:ribosome maturation factor RimM [Actinomycetales bacterium]
MDRVVARIGRAHGLRGEVTVEVRTDVPEQRFVDGARFTTNPVSHGPLTLRSVRENNGVLLLGFEGVDDRTAAEELRGTMLLVDAEASDEPDAWYDEELVGLRAERADGTVLGEVSGLLTGGAQDLLEVRPTRGPRSTTVLVPFVTALVPVVDIAGGRVVLEPPGGMFDVDEADGEDV